MKCSITFSLIIISIVAFSQTDVVTTRKTHLLKETNQATYKDNLTVLAGEKVAVYEFLDNGYYKVRYNFSEYYVYYPYFSEIETLNLHPHTTSKSKANNTYRPKRNNSPSRTIHTGPRGGRYYINSHGKKTYIKKK